MRSREYIYFCGLVLGWQLNLITTQSEEPSSTEYITEAFENVTEHSNSATPYSLTFTNNNELLFGTLTEQMEHFNGTASFYSNQNMSVPIFTSLNASFGVRIKAPTVPTVTEYTFNDIDYKFLAYNYDYESLLRSANNRSASNQSASNMPTVVYHKDGLISPFQGQAYSPPFGNPNFMPKNNVGPNSIYTYKNDLNAETKRIPEFRPAQTLLNGIQLRNGRRTVGRSTVKDSTTAAPTKSFRTKASPTKSVTSNKKRTQTTKRGRKQTSTTTSSSKRFRAVVHRNGLAAKSRIPSNPTPTRSLRTRTSSTVRGENFRSVRPTRTPRRRRPTKTRRFRTLRRTKPTIRKTPIARPRFRKATRRPRVVRPQIFDYDFIYF